MTVTANKIPAIIQLIVTQLTTCWQQLSTLALYTIKHAPDLEAPKIHNGPFQIIGVHPYGGRDLPFLP